MVRRNMPIDFWWECHWRTLSGSKKCMEILDRLSDWQLLWKVPTPGIWLLD
jgi:hypothetical protein